MTTSSNTYSRRRFISQTGCAALTSIPMLSTMMNLGLISRAAAQSAGSGGGNYKATVCLFHFGGWDSFNVLVPGDNDGYENYRRARGGFYNVSGSNGIALPESDLLNLNNITYASGKTLRVHKNLPRIKAMLNGDSGAPVNGAIIANCGPLVRPGTTGSNYRLSEYQPYGLFSHSDQQKQWQTTFRSSREATGWGGNMIDLLNSSPDNIPWASNIALGSSNTWQTGGYSNPYVAASGNSTDALAPHTGFGGLYPKVFTQTVEKLFNPDLRVSKNGVLSRVFHDVVGNAVSRSALLGELFGLADTIAKAEENLSASRKSPITKVREYYGSEGSSLRTIAELIALRHTNVAPYVSGTSEAIAVLEQAIEEVLTLSHQTFFAATGGWDTHDDVINTVDTNLSRVDNLVSRFFEALKVAGLQNCVTLFFASDFGRTLRSNGRGSDHAWGGNYMVFGGNVVRGCYGTFPGDLSNLATGSGNGGNIDAGSSRIVPTTSVDSYFSTIARWMGVTDGAGLELLFPTLAGNAFPKNLGFLG